MDNEWKNSLRERFSDYSAPEPEGLWEGIEQGLAGKPRRKMLPVWLATGLAAAAAVALVVVLPSRKEDKTALESADRYAETVDRFPVEAENDETVSVPADTAISDAEPVEVSEVQSAGSAVSKSIPFAVASRHTLLSEAEPTQSVPVSDDVIPDAVHEVVPAGVPARETTVPEKKEVVITETKSADKTVEEVLRDVTPSLEIMPARERRRAFSIGAYQGGGQAASEQSQGFGLNRTGEYLTRATNTGAPRKAGELMNMLSSNRASTYEAHHGIPVRTGVTAAWELSKHLSLTSGVNWTSLTSTFDETTAGETRTSTRQNLGYLGVPLRLEAGFEPVNHLRLYANAGGMVEKGLLATSKTDSYIGDHLEDTVTGHPDTGGLLWSVGASAGAEYRINDFIGVYLAPGLEYHFDNGAEARSAYTEKPLHWNVNLGVRFNIAD